MQTRLHQDVYALHVGGAADVARRVRLAANKDSLDLVQQLQAQLQIVLTDIRLQTVDQYAVHARFRISRR